MVSAKSVQEQLRAIKFVTKSWNRGEVKELSNIILDDEKIFECVSGWYEGGVALLVASNFRILLVDKKPLKFLTVEDLRFDMINQIDYSHRLLDARIVVSAGSKNLKFRSYNQQRLRKLIGHVQHRMAEIKTEQSTHTERQQEHLKQIDQQLQTYLIAQYQQHESMRRQLSEVGNTPVANSYNTVGQNYIAPQGALIEGTTTSNTVKPEVDDTSYNSNGISSNELYKDGMREVFGRVDGSVQNPSPNQTMANNTVPTPVAATAGNHLEINPLKIAYSKLPMLLRDRQYGRKLLTRSVKPNYDPASS